MCLLHTTAPENEGALSGSPTALRSPHVGYCLFRIRFTTPYLDVPSRATSPPEPVERSSI